MRYRTVRVLALATLLPLTLAPLARAGQPAVRALRPAAAAAHSPALSAPSVLSSLLGLLQGLWRGAEDRGGQGGRDPHGDPPHSESPEGSGLCPHGQH